MFLRECGKGETDKRGIRSLCTSHLVSCWPNVDIGNFFCIFDLMELKLCNRVDNSNLNRQIFLYLDSSGFWWEKEVIKLTAEFYFYFLTN